MFADVAEVILRSTPDRSRAVAAINAAQPGPGSTKFGPALKLASSMLAESLLPRKEVIVVSDFQRGGWLPDDTLRMPGGTQVTPVVVEGAQGLNLAVTPVALLRTSEGGQERITVTASVLNRSGDAVTNVPIHLEVDGASVQDLQISAAPHASASVTFPPLTITSANTKASVRLGSAGQSVDALERDNVFHFVVTPAAPVPVLLVSQARAEENLYLSRALAIGEQPRFDTSLQSPDALAGDAMNRARLMILNDVPIGDAAAAKLVTFVEGGGGLLIAAGQRASWPAARAQWLPVSIGPPVDRTRGAPARLSGMDYGHAVFEPFRAPRSGDFSTSRFYSYRGLSAAKDATVLARFDTGEPALVERSAGRGRVVVFASTLDLSWNDLALKPMFLPFVHQLGRHLSGFKEQPAWLTIGQVLDVDAAEIAAGATSAAHARAAAGRTVLAPADSAATSRAGGIGAAGARCIGCGECAGAHRAGFLRNSRRGTRRGTCDRRRQQRQPHRVQSRSNGSERACFRCDGRQCHRLNVGPGRLTRRGPGAAQRVWWYLLFAGILLLIAETVLAHRLSRATR